MFLKKHYQDLVECQSLLNTLRGLEDQVVAAQKRLSYLEQKDREKKTELETQLNLIREGETLQAAKEVELLKIIVKLENLNQNSGLVKNTSQEKIYLEEELHLIQRRDQLEIEIYQILEDSEKLSTSVEEIKEFLSNLPKAIAEIKGEVDQEVIKHQKEIESLRERIKNLLSLIPKDLAEIFRNQVKKFHRGLIFARTFNNRCESCRFHVDQRQIENIHRFIGLEFCGSCQRLLIPENLH